MGQILGCALDISEYCWQSQCADMVLISTIISDFWSSEGTTLKITQIHVTSNVYSCSLLDTGERAPWLSGKLTRGFPRHLPSLGRQLPEIDIKIRFIEQLYNNLKLDS